MAALACRLAALGPELVAAKAASAAVAAARDATHSARYTRLAAAADAVAAALCPIYARLTAGAGAAALSFARDPAAAFAEGVEMRVRPGSVAWRRLQVLSGGQAALAAMALVLAQPVRAPLVFLDECNTVLNSLRAAHLADLLRERAATPGAPLLVAVSHRDETAARAHTLAGVCAAPGGASLAVTYQVGADRAYEPRAAD
jgi:chromosome segregation ATPase